jgi:hypothetical protein
MHNTRSSLLAGPMSQKYHEPPQYRIENVISTRQTACLTRRRIFRSCKRDEHTSLSLHLNEKLLLLRSASFHRLGLFAIRLGKEKQRSSWKTRVVIFVRQQAPLAVHFLDFGGEQDRATRP